MVATIVYRTPWNSVWSTKHFCLEILDIVLEIVMDAAGTVKSVFHYYKGLKECVLRYVGPLVSILHKKR